jgi:protein PhnA
MAILQDLESRCELKCEICGNVSELYAYLVSPKVEEKTENQVALCNVYLDQVSNREHRDEIHWRSLQESIWSPVPAVQVLSYRLLEYFQEQPWAEDTLGMVMIDDQTMDWVNSAFDLSPVHKDSNGNILKSGDTVTLIQDLNVKGGGFTAKRGTAVRKIKLVEDNEEHIEGKIESQQIVILTKYVKKA